MDDTDLETLYSCDVCRSDQLKMIDAACLICACQSCGYVFDNPRPTARAIAAFYSQPRKYDGWLSAERARDRLWKRRLSKMRRIHKPGSLLDVGTGIGQFLYHARPYYSSILGTEVSDAAIRIAKEKYNLVIEKGDLESVHLREGNFDNITLFHVLEHVPSPRSLIERCRTLLRNEGVLVVAVPNDLRCAANRVKLLLKGLGSRKYSSLGRLGLSRITLDGSIQEIHLSHFTPEVLQRLLEWSGFCVLENTLDPQYAADGAKELIWATYYAVSHALRFALRINVYETIWVAATKDGT